MMSAPLNLALLKAYDIVLFMRTLVSKRLEAGGSSTIFKRKFIIFDSDTDSMLFSLEWFVIKDKGGICYCPILWHFMLLYEVNGVGESSFMYVPFGQVTQLIGKTSCPHFFSGPFNTLSIISLDPLGRKI